MKIIPCSIGNASSKLSAPIFILFAFWVFFTGVQQTSGSLLIVIHQAGPLDFPEIAGDFLKLLFATKMSVDFPVDVAASPRNPVETWESNVMGKLSWANNPRVATMLMILLMEKILHHLWCPKCWLYPYIKTFSGIRSGAGFFPSTVFQALKNSPNNLWQCLVFDNFISLTVDFCLCPSRCDA